ncbi:MAG TPA: hypothetical protein VEA16_14520 [Vicinamibacterales bacterium]|nr:hypothetical protein [Vicinamibacterales bacterium]
MKILIAVPLILLLSADKVSAQQAHADFSRFARALGQEIVLVDREGVVREGVLADVNADQLTMTFGGGQKTFTQAEIFSADRVRDRTLDGAIKGAIVGGVLGLMMQAKSEWTLGATISYSIIGLLIDASQTHREPIYRAAPQPASLKFSLRF